MLLVLFVLGQFGTADMQGLRGLEVLIDEVHQTRLVVLAECENWCVAVRGTQVSHVLSEAFVEDFEKVCLLLVCSKQVHVRRPEVGVVGFLEVLDLAHRGVVAEDAWLESVSNCRRCEAASA